VRRRRHGAAISRALITRAQVFDPLSTERASSSRVPGAGRQHAEGHLLYPKVLGRVDAGFAV
jgi:hypothetical protein